MIDQKRHLASNLNFHDPMAQKVSALDATGVLIGHPAASTALPAEAFFTPKLTLKNESDTQQTATVKLNFSAISRFENRTIPPIKLAPHEVRTVDLSRFTAGLRDEIVEGAGLAIEHTGEPGSIVAALCSVDETRGLVVDAPFVSRRNNSGEGGNHPFELNEQFRSVAYLTNITEKPTKVMVIIFHEGGLFTPELVKVGAGQTVTLDLLKMRDEQVKDVQGRTLPKDLSKGQVFWHPHEGEALIGRVVKIDRATNTASSFGCPYCCIQEPFRFDVTPEPIAGGVGEFVQMQVMEWDSMCGNLPILGPYDVTSSCSYVSNNTAIATVNSTGGVTFTGLGSTSITMSIDYLHSYAITAEDCAMDTATETENCPVNSYTLRIRPAGSALHSEDAANSATIIAGESFSLIIEAVDANGNVVVVNGAVSTSTSRTLGSTETGLPSTFNLSSGSYTSGGLTLNRVNGTERGTTFRFSLGGVNTDFFLYTYFRVSCTREGLVGGLLYCGGTVQANDHFISLPVSELCGVSFVVRNPTTLQSETTTKKDRGPHFPGPNTACDPTGSVGGDPPSGTPAPDPELKA